MAPGPLPLREPREGWLLDDEAGDELGAISVPRLRRRRWRAAGCYLVFRERSGPAPAPSAGRCANQPSCCRRRNAGTSSGDGSSIPSND